MPLRSVNNKWSLDRFRGLIIGTAITIGTIVVANVIVLAQLHQSALREVQSNLLRQSLALSTVVERTFQSTDLVLASVAEKVRLAAAADGDLHQLTNVDYYVFLKEKMSGLPQIDALGILDAEGKRLNLSREWPSPNTDLSYREYFRAIKENPKITSFVSQPVQASANGTWVVILARPVLAADGKLLGLVFASAPMKYFEELFHSTSLGEGYAAALMRQDGTLLARYPVAGDNWKESAGFSADKVGRFEIGSFAFNKSIRSSSAYSCGLPPCKLSPRCRRNAERGGCIRALAHHSCHNGPHRVHNDCPHYHCRVLDCAFMETARTPQ